MSRKSRERRKQYREEHGNSPEEIFKMQRPLGGEMGVMLIYNESRSITFTLPMYKRDRKLFGEKPKIYVRAAIIDTIFTIEEIVEDQNW